MPFLIFKLDDFLTQRTLLHIVSYIILHFLTLYTEFNQKKIGHHCLQIIICGYIT